jgi:uncharacterized protein
MLQYTRSTHAEKTMTEEAPSPITIVFPCNYPIKVVADSHPELVNRVIAILQSYDATVTVEKVKERASRSGKFTSVTVQFIATGEAQLKAMFEQLKTHSWVHMVL